MKIETILDEWEKDAKLDDKDLEASTLKFATIHAKYLRAHSNAKLRIARLKREKSSLKKDKWRYYTGKMTQGEMDEKSWKYDPFDGCKPLKSDLGYYYDSDDDLNDIDMKITYYETVTEALKEILDTIRWRHTVVKNILEAKKFEAGY